MKLNCSIVTDIQSLYKENKLTEDVRASVKEHLSECEECRKLYEKSASPPEETKGLTTEPSIKNDEKLLLKQKFSRLRTVFIFTIAVICITAYSMYSQSRVYLHSDFQGLAQELYSYFLHIEGLKRSEKSSDSNTSYNQRAGALLNEINKTYGHTARNFNLLEKYGINKNYSHQCFNLQMSTLVLTLNNRWQNGYFSELDEEVYNRLTSEMDILWKLFDDYSNKLNRKSFIIDTGKINDSLDKLNLLARVYTRYNKLPEELTYLSDDKLKTRISYVLGLDAKKIRLSKTSGFNYRYEAAYDSSGNPYNGEIDSVTGRLLKISGGKDSSEGDLIDVEKAKDTIMELISRNLGEDFGVNFEYLGLNAYFWSETGSKVHTFDIYTTFKGYNIFDKYRVLVDARKNTIYDYRSLEFKGNTPLAAAESLKSEVKYSPEEALKNLVSPDINKEDFKYKSTYFIKSMFTGEYVLVHYYEEVLDKKRLFINAETGKEEWPSYSDDMIFY